MKFLGLLLLFTSAFSYADCRVQNTVIPDGESKTLFEENGSLASHKTQDQDGLGTCYANTTSVVLKSVLPGNPDISYTHAAVQGSTKGILQDWSRGGAYLSTDENNQVQNFTHGGSICNTVDALKNNGGACASRYSMTENKTLMDPNSQGRLFRSLGAYFDELNRFKNNPSEMESHRQRLAEAFEAVNLQRDSVVQECRELQSDVDEQELPLSQAVGGLIGNMMLSLEDSQCDQQMHQAFRNLLNPNSTIGDDRIIAKPSPATVRRFREAISRDESLSEDFKNFAKNGSESRSFKHGIRDRLIPIFRSLISESIPSCGGTDLLSGDLPSDYATEFMNAARTQFQNPCAAVLAQPSSSNLEALQCFSSPDFNLIKDAIAPLLEINGRLETSQLQALLNTRNENADQMRDLLFPECEQPSNLISMNNISCQSESMCAGSPDQLRVNNGSYNGPAGACHDMNAAKNIARAKVMDGIRNNRALGISVCSGFLYAPSVRSNFCQDYVPGPSVAHDMTVSGYRCVGDKIEYQVVNSWGKSCPPGATDPSGSIKCDPSENGKFWVDEHVLINNSTSISEVKGGN